MNDQSIPAAAQPLPSLRHSPATQLATYWIVVLGWMVVISCLSTDPFSAANTGRYLDPLLRFFFPHLTAAQFAKAHFAIRKTAHVTEFFVLGSLTFWACRRGRAPRWRLAWAGQALALAVVYALLDEVHQVFVPSRTASLFDCGIDSLGAAASQLAICLRYLLSSKR